MGNYPAVPRRSRTSRTNASTSVSAPERSMVSGPGPTSRRSGTQPEMEAAQVEVVPHPWFTSKVLAAPMPLARFRVQPQICTTAVIISVMHGPVLWTKGQSRQISRFDS